MCPCLQKLRSNTMLARGEMTRLHLNSANRTSRTTSRMMGQGTKVHSRVVRCLHALSATVVYNALPNDFEKEVMLSSGGPMVGKVWSEVPRILVSFMDNDHFHTALQLRLALLEAPPGSMCQIAKINDTDDKCLKDISNPCSHPHLCKLGPARQRPHRALMMSMKRVLERAGASVDLEQAISALYRINSEGKLLKQSWMSLLSPRAAPVRRPSTLQFVAHMRSTSQALLQTLRP